MTAKDFLKRYRNARYQIQNCETEIEEIETKLMPSAIRTDKEPTGGGPGYYGEELLAEAADRKHDLYTMREDALRIMVEVSTVISKVHPAELSRLLHMRYIECMRWEEIAVDMNYDIRWVYRLHGQALVKVNDILNEESSTRH
jgi:hypothetical protein